MSAEGYQSAPLSDAMERRIRERLTSLRTQYEGGHVPAMISCLEWVLNEAEALKAEGARWTGGARKSPDLECPVCFHQHEGRNDCGKYLGEEKFCHCEHRMTA